MPLCPRCQQEITESAVACPHCGHQLRAGASETPGGPDTQISTQMEAIEGMIPPAYQVRPGYYLKEGWVLLKRNLPGFVGFTLFWFLIHIALDRLGNLGNVVGWVISAPLMAGPFIVSAKLLRGLPVQTNDFFAGFRFLQPLILYGLISGALIGLGFILLILPGVILMVCYTFSIPAIIDRRLDFWPAMELSRKVVQRQWFAMFGCLALLMLVNLGALALGVGLLVTVPWSVCAITVAYHDILGLQAASYEP